MNNFRSSWTKVTKIVALMKYYKKNNYQEAIFKKHSFSLCRLLFKQLVGSEHKCTSCHQLLVITEHICNHIDKYKQYFMFFRNIWLTIFYIIKVVGSLEYFWLIYSLLLISNWTICSCLLIRKSYFASYGTFK